METLNAYFAGAIDADGCISIYRKQHRRKVDGVFTIYYDARVSLGEVRPEIPDLFMKTFGGCRSTSIPKSRPKSRPYHQWCASNQVVRTVLLAIRPYLILKAEQADVVIRFCTLLADYRKTGIATVTTEQEAARRELYEQIKQLNGSCRRRDYAALTGGIL